MTAKKKFNFIRPTLKFCIAGLFIPGFTAGAIMGLQMGIELIGMECSIAWIILWTLTAIGMVVAPFIFIRLMDRRLSEGFNLTIDKLIFFNIIEYTCIQATLAVFFTNTHNLCYVADGQNGIEFAFTGWMTIPFLIALSFRFDHLREEKVYELKANKLSNEQRLE